MKKEMLVLSCLAAFFILLPMGFLQAENLENAIQQSFERLSDEYVKHHPVKSTKRGLAILKFTEVGDAAKSKGLGNTVREIYSRKILTSQVFYLIDRDSLDESIREMQLSMSGLIGEKSVIEAGKLSSARVFMGGSISEIQDRFQINVKLVDSETGRVIAQETVEVKQRDLIRMKQEIAFAYMAQHGIGINFQYSYGFIHSPADYVLTYTDVFVNYRPFLWLSFKLGLTTVDLGFNEITNIRAQTIFPTLPGSEESIDYSEGDLNEISPYVGIDFNYTPSDKFTIGFGIGFNYFREPILTQHFSPLYYYNETTTSTEQGGVFDVIQEMKPLYLLRLEIKPQYFITPRMTVGLYFAYIFSNQFRVYKSLINNEYSGFIGADSGNTEHELEMQTKYYNIPLSILADGRNINDVDFNMSYALGISFNFYF